MATHTGPLTNITLLTDFGTRDGYVGAMKGVLASRAPDAAIQDISHDIPPGDVEAAARTLDRYWSWWPRGTVHLVVVDPGVGTDRAPLAAEAEGRFLVGPDNGVGTPFLRVAGSRIVHLHGKSPPGSATFHGRDLFAPAAASLATGTPLDHLGTALPHPLLLPWETSPGPRGRIVAWDHFGNFQTDLIPPRHGPPFRVRVGGLLIPLRRTYGDVDSGDPLALLDSQGRLEIAVRDGSARERFGWERGQEVELEPAEDGRRTTGGTVPVPTERQVPPR